MIDYNKKYIFISDGTWFKKGTECIVEDGHCLWDNDELRPYFNYLQIKTAVEVSYERMMDSPDRISGIFQGLRISSGTGELQAEGEEYEDGEVCLLDEFEVIKR